MTATIRILLLGVAMALQACAATRTVQQSTELADAGIAYAAVTSQVMADARDRYLLWNGQALINEFDPDDPGCTPEELSHPDEASESCQAAIKDFDASTERAHQFATSISVLQAHTQTLGAYFTALKRLADSGAPSGAETATQQLADQINGLNERLGGDSVVTEAQKAAYGQLAGLVITAVKGRALSKALERDKVRIAQAIDLQERTISKSVTLLRAFGEAETAGTALTKVRTPYLTGTIDDPAEWVSTRTETVLYATVIEKLEAVQSASSRLRLIWDDILHDRSDPAAAQQLFSDLAQVFDVLGQVRAANHN